MAKQFTGKVISAKMQKTVTVLVEWKTQHPMYRKIITKRKKFMAHYENMEVKEGDTVVISETRPISKNIHFVVTSIVPKATH